MRPSEFICLIALAFLATEAGCAGRQGPVPAVTESTKTALTASVPHVQDAGFLYVANNGNSGSVTAYELGQMTLQRTITSGITTPEAVVADRTGTLYVANQNTVTEYAPGQGSPLRTISGPSLCCGSHPQELALDSSGNLYVANGGACYPNDTVTVYAPGQITPARTVTLPDGECKPFAVAVDGQGNFFAITQTFSGHAGSVYEYAPGQSTPMRTIADAKATVGIALDANGNLYVVNNGSLASGDDSSVTIYAPGATVPSRTIAGLQSALADAIDAGGNLYIADTGHNVVKVYPPGSTSPARVLPAQSPGALAFDGFDNVYVLNQSNGTVTVFDSESATPLLTVSSGIDVPSGIAVGAAPATTVPCASSRSGSGNAFVCAFKPNAITISTSEGAPYGDVDFWTLTNTIPEEFAGAYGPTRVMRAYICLSGMVADSQCTAAQQSRLRPLSKEELDGLAARLALFRGTGVRALVRFVYNLGGSGAPDAPLKVMLAQLSQVAPILRNNRDVVFALEAGFIGQWGEWHDSTYGNDTVKAQNAILAAEFHDFPSMFPILIRDPGDAIAYFNDTTVRAQAGIHDDCYASQRWDCGTFNSTYSVQDPLGLSEKTLRAYAQAQSVTSILVGEPAGLTPTYDLRSCQAFLKYAYTYHLQSLNIFAINVPALVNNWNEQGCLSQVTNSIGTRIVLDRAVVTGAIAAGGTLHASITMENDGFGRVVRERPIYALTLVNGTPIARTTVTTVDLRTLRSADPPVQSTFSFDIPLPNRVPDGVLSLALYVADPADPASAAYALPLNSVDSNGNEIFDGVTGYNTFATLSR